MTIITRLLVVCLVLYALAACTGTRPPAALVEQIESQSTAEELANIRLVYINEHDLVLKVPRRWIPTQRKKQRDSFNEVRLAFQDRGNRNAHGLLWVLNDPGRSSNLGSWAVATMRNKTNSYSYATSAARLKWQSLDIGEHSIYGWRAKVSVLGNFRDMALFYARKPIPQGPDKWLMVFMRNQGSYKPLDLEKDIKDIVTPIITSFLDGPIGSEPIKE